MKYKELKQELKELKKSYYDKDIKKRLFHTIVKQPDIVIYKIVKEAKLYKYFKENSNNIINKIKVFYYARKVNRNSMKYQIELYREIWKKFKGMPSINIIKRI